MLREIAAAFSGLGLLAAGAVGIYRLHPLKSTPALLLSADVL